MALRTRIVALECDMRWVVVVSCVATTSPAVADPDPVATTGASAAVGIDTSYSAGDCGIAWKDVAAIGGQLATRVGRLGLGLALARVVPPDGFCDSDYTSGTASAWELRAVGGLVWARRTPRSFAFGRAGGGVEIVRVDAHSDTSGAPNGPADDRATWAGPAIELAGGVGARAGRLAVGVELVVGAARPFGREVIRLAPQLGLQAVLGVFASGDL